MTWLATVIQTTPVGSQYESSVRFANDQDTTQNFQQSFLYDGTTAALNAAACTRVAELQNMVSAGVPAGTSLDLSAVNVIQTQPPSPLVAG